MAGAVGPEPYYSLFRCAGDLVFLSAFGPVDASMQVVGQTIEEQTTACMEAMGRALAAAGASLDDLVCVDVFLADLADRDGFNAAYARHFGRRDRMPARRLYGAGALFKGIKVEVAGIAARGAASA
jgi:enamine deaminase RidA (YjgF/YER057c/UK114 family)